MRPHLWNEDRFSISICLSSGRSRGWRAIPRALHDGSRSRSWVQSSVSRPFLCRSLSCRNQRFLAYRFLVSKAERGCTACGGGGAVRPGGRWPLERRESGLKDLLYVGGGAGGVREYLWPRPGRLQVSLPPSAAGRPRHSMGVGKEKRRGVHPFLRRRSAEQGAGAWFLGALLRLRNRTHGQRSAGGGANSGPARRAGH